MSRLIAMILIAASPIGAQVKKAKRTGGQNQAEAKQFEYIAQKPAKILLGGKPISLNVQSARISDLIRLFQEKTGLNIIASDKIAGSFTAHVDGVPARDALRSILEVNNLYFIESPKSNLVRIVTRNEYQDYAVTNFVEERVYTIPLGKARTVGRAVKPMLTKGISRLLVDEKNNRIVVMDLPERLGKVDKVIDAFTSSPAQIFIECQIYEIELTDGFEFGIDWSAIDIPKIVNRVQTTFIPRDSTDNTIPANQGFNIFRSEGLSGGGSVSALINMVGQDTNIEAVASPKIITQHNQKAEIYVGRQIPYNETIVQGLTGNQSSSFKFLDTGTKLLITPQITQNGDVQLNLEIEVSSSPGFVEFGENGAVGKAPEKISTSAQTSISVKDKGIVILGGLIRNEDRLESKGIPLLMDIPIIKYLFSYRTTVKNKTETVIFIQPKIMRKDKFAKIPARYKEKIKQAETK